MSTPVNHDALMHTLRSFCLEGDVISCTPYGGGHINSTQLVTDSGGRRYILQRINTHVFRNVEALMENIRLVKASVSEERILGLTSCMPMTSAATIHCLTLYSKMTWKLLLCRLH